VAGLGGSGGARVEKPRDVGSYSVFNYYASFLITVECGKVSGDVSEILSKLIFQFEMRVYL